MTTQLYTVCKLGNGQLSVMPKPDHEQMERDVRHYRSQGVTKVISLLLPKEIEELQMQQEPEVCDAHEIEFVNFSIKDMSVPEMDDLQTFNTQLKQDLENGHHLAIHCHGGRGRAGIVAISLMVEHGISAEQAIEMASKARGDRMPVNELQTEFVKNYQPAS
ncbi:hypothetical protein QCB45_00825 [Thiomicrorhabdus sp. ZW0627]|uniref:protein-tyrosine phosphatase family protein n=1 Tax=Thiomicrorhabdus sp. ZW0627 TaxID=3039774 RepID=UPI00243662E0|nr:hypothetical protein [Thiomicrorhabdus sp. ZW0627]MDG6772870.1 hypothetical protein [Thiomicrorhabdus sp. ZW0627]